MGFNSAGHIAGAVKCATNGLLFTDPYEPVTCRGGIFHQVHTIRQAAYIYRPFSCSDPAGV